MAEKKVSVRLVAMGGDQVRAELVGVGDVGTTAFRNLDTAAQSTGREFNGFRSQIQNASYQIGDFAVQVGGGTSAATALAQQLPQLLGGFGLVGAVMGTVAAVGIPLARAFFQSGEAAKTLAENVSTLEAALSRLNSIDEMYSTDGIQGLIDKYGELNGEILLLIERQRTFALESTLLAAKDAASSLKGELSGVLDALAVYNSYASGTSQNALDAAAGAAQQLQEEFGLTVLQAQALELSINAALRTDDVDVMASAIASISTALEDTTFAGSEFAGALLDAESALRSINVEAGGISGWLNVAIGGTRTWAASLWEAASAARAAAMESGPARGIAPGTGGPGTFAPGSLPGAPPPMRPQTRPTGIDFGYIPSTGGGSPGGGTSPADQVVQDSEEMAAAVDKILEDVAQKYESAGKRGADAIAGMMQGIIDGSMSAKDALSGLLAKIGQVALQNGIAMLGQSSGTAGTIFAALGNAIGGNANGTNYWRGGPTWVGERGPEILNLPRGSQIMDAQRSRQMAGGGGAVSVSISVENGNLIPIIQQVSGAVSAQAVKSYDREFNGRSRAATSDRRLIR